MRTIGAVVIMVVAIVGLISLTLTTAWTRDAAREAAQQAATSAATEPAGDGAGGGVLVDDSVSRGTSWKALCPTMDGGVDVSCLVDIDGGSIHSGMTDITVTSTSTTCARFGFDSRVDQNHGVPVGAGCAAGTIYPTHAKECRCQSAGAAVVVDVTGARP